MKQANICVVTGTRAEFGIWRPVLRALLASNKLHLQLVVTGMHLQKSFGHTIDDIRREGFPIAARIAMYHANEDPAASLARATLGLAKAFRRLQPDFVMVLGDRLEIFAAAAAALAGQIPLAHLHGGETAPGQWDEQIRHAVTKIAHLHFCATATAAKRIQQMGEDPRTIHTVGAPALDSAADFLRSFHHIPSPSAFRIPHSAFTPPILVLLHPTSPDDALEEKRTTILLAALRSQPFQMLGPNNDPGHRGILRACRRKNIPLTMSLPQEKFWQLLAHAPALVGNSSAGILEAASFGTPVINIGDRQAGRERNPNVIDVPWQSARTAIPHALHHALHDPAFRRRLARRNNLYGDGHAAPRILKILESLPFPLLTAKRWHKSKT